jgi:hypothetical protein
LAEIDNGNDGSKNGASSRDSVEPFLQINLLVPVSLLVGLPLIIFGCWLNSYGIDRARFIPTIMGWSLMVSGGIPVMWLLLVFFAHLVN